MTEKQFLYEVNRKRDDYGVECFYIPCDVCPNPNKMYITGSVECYEKYIESLKTRKLKEILQ